MHRDNNYETTEYCIHHFAKQNILLYTQTLLIKVANDETYLLILFLSV